MRTIKAPRGTQPSCKGRGREAARRRLLNHRDPQVAERPNELRRFSTSDIETELAVRALLAYDLGAAPLVETKLEDALALWFARSRQRADFVIYDCRAYRELAYFAGLERPAAVYVKGELVGKKPDKQISKKPIKYLEQKAARKPSF